MKQSHLILRQFFYGAFEWLTLQRISFHATFQKFVSLPCELQCQSFKRRSQFLSPFKFTNTNNSIEFCLIYNLRVYTQRKLNTHLSLKPQIELDITSWKLSFLCMTRLDVLRPQSQLAMAVSTHVLSFIN